MQKKSRSKTALPKIKSQERIDRLLRKDRPVENYNQDDEEIKVKWNKTITGSKSSKAFRYEANFSVYVRKIDELQKRQGELMKEISRIQGNIGKIRDQKINIKGKIKKNTLLDSQNQSRTTKLQNQLDVQNQIILTENKIQRLRKRVDKEKEKNAKISNQVDISRKQLNTSKNVIRNIQISLNKIAQLYNQQLSVCTSLDQQIRLLNGKLLEQRAISAEQKHTVTKQYEEILKKLKEELQEEQHKEKKSEKQFYMTQIERQQSLNKNYGSSQNKKTISVQILRNKLQKYEQDLTDIKKWAHINTPDEITHKFLQKHSQNFKQYEYVQNYFQSLDALRRQKRQLLDKKTMMSQELFSGPTDSINLLNEQIQQIESEKQCYKQNVDKFERTFESIKQIIIKCGPKMGLKIENQVDEQKVEGILMMIKDLKLQIDQKKEYSETRNSSDKLILQEELEGVKKGEFKEQSQRILERNDFLTIREAIMKRKKKGTERQK